MGGVAGHMDHLYDNPNLSFNELKEILTAASNGELKVEEKVDGQNLFLSYSIAENKAKGARNKGNIKNGGLDADELARMFAGRGSLTKVFEDGFAAFEKSIEPLSDEEKNKIFGPNANIWYNAEIMYPGSKDDPQDPGHINVINYDNKTLKIHNVGHFLFDYETGIQHPIPEGSLESMDKAYDRMQDSLKGNKFSLAREAIIELKKLEDGDALSQALRRINSEISSEGLSDKSTIQEYVSARLANGIDAELSPDIKKELVKYLVKDPGNIGLRALKKGLNPEQLQDIIEIVSAKDMLLKEAIGPIEMAIHDFSVGILKGMKSVFIADTSEEVNRLRTELSTAVKQITNVGPENPEAMVVLQQHLNKIKDFENITTPVEGIIFDFNGHTYKFVGNFAPLNQILGMFRYGNLASKNTSENLEKGKNRLNEGKSKRTALLPGGFKPPHAGHYQLAKELSSLDDINEVIVIIGKNPRESTVDPKTIITAEQSKELWDLYTRNDKNIKVRIQVGKTPVGDVYDLIADENSFSEGDTIILGKSDKDEDAGDARFQRAQSYAERHNPGVSVEEKIMPVYGGKDMGGTTLRNMISKGEKEDFLSKIPNHLSPSEKEEAWNTVSSPKKNLNNFIDSTIEEMSSMSGGSVQGSMGLNGFGPPNNYNSFKKGQSNKTRRPSVKRAKRQRRR